MRPFRWSQEFNSEVDHGLPPALGLFGESYNTARVPSMPIDHLPEHAEWAKKVDITFDFPQPVVCTVERIVEGTHCQPWTPRQRHP